MLGLGKFVFFVEDVPSQWIFEHYLSLNEKLIGQDLKLSSVFNREKTPSMYLYTVDGQYRFKDFSSSKSGDGIDLVRELYDLSYISAKQKILTDYESYLTTGSSELDREFMGPQDRYKVTAYTTRGWNEADALYWKQFKIGSDMLKSFNVKAIEGFTMSKTLSDGTVDTIVSNELNVYGYFNAEGELCKLYRPGKKNRKFIKVKDYIQGSDQLTNALYLVICSSLKDAMALKAMKFNGVDIIVPDSENTIIPKDYMEALKSKYVKICTLFDNDAAGLKSMLQYEEEYQLPYVHLQMEKDIADSVKEHGINNTRIVLYPLLTKVLTGTAKYI